MKSRYQEATRELSYSEEEEEVMEEIEEEQDEERSSSEQEEQEEQEEELRKNLAQVPFEMLVRLQDKTRDEPAASSKRVRSFGSGEAGGEDDEENARAARRMRSAPPTTYEEYLKKREKLKRANKNRPMEMSSKRPVSRKREVVELSKDRSRDPRFDNMSGSLRTDLFQRSYGFLEDYRKSELEMLQTELKKEKDPRERARIHQLISKMKSQMLAKKKEEDRASIKREWRKKELELVQQGKKPFFMKKAEEKKLELIQKYKQLTEAGQHDHIDKMLEKRRKKNASKDHRKLPARRQHNQ